MTKKFSEYLHRVLVQFLCKELNSHSDDDRRLYVLCRLMTVSENLKAGFTCIQTAEQLNCDYLRDFAKADTWWRS